MKWNLPNSLTVARILIIPVFMWSFSQNPLLAMAIFLIAAITDALDGHLARKNNQVTTFGKFLDPIADKLLVFSALLLFVEVGQAPVWVAMLVIARELLVTGLRILAIDKKIIIPAGISGKVKTMVQIIAVLWMLSPLAYTNVDGNMITNYTNDIAVYAILVVTLWSGIDYFYKFRKIFVD